MTDKYVKDMGLLFVCYSTECSKLIKIDKRHLRQFPRETNIDQALLLIYLTLFLPLARKIERINRK